MKATHKATIKIATGELVFKCVIVRSEGEKLVLQQVKNGRPYGATFFADKIAPIAS